MTNYKGPIRCQWGNCTMTFKCGNECYTHVRRYHIKMGMTLCKWNNCHKLSTSRCNLANHAIIHINVVKKVCQLCEKEFKWNTLHRKHMSRHTKSEMRLAEVVDILFEL